VDWLRRTGRPAGRADPAPVEPESEAIEGAAPGLAALLESVGEHRELAVLDLGPASESSLRWYGAFARRVRFADFLSDGRRSQQYASLADRLAALPPQPHHPYDVIMVWDVLDRLVGEDRQRLVRRLAELSAPDAVLHAMVLAPEHATLRPQRFTVIETGRIRYEPTSPLRLPRVPVRPADLAPLFAPFRIVRAFTLKGGLREYLTAKPGVSGITIR